MRSLMLLPDGEDNHRACYAHIEIAGPLAASGLFGGLTSYAYWPRLHALRSHHHAHRIAALSREIPPNADVVLWGCGAYGIGLIDELRGVRVGTLCDSDPRLWGQRRAGLPIRPPRDVSAKAHFLVGSVDYEREIEATIRATVGEAAAIHRTWLSDAEHQAVNRTIVDEIAARIEAERPDLLVFAPAGVGDTLSGEVLLDLRARFPSIKIFTQWIDYADDSQNWTDFEKATLEASDFVAISDTFTRYERIRRREGAFADYPHIERLHWHRVVPDPRHFFHRDIEKPIDIGMFGTPIGEREKYFRFLAARYGSRLHWIGSKEDGRRHIPVTEYAERLCQTRIAVNAQTDYRRPAIKGKVHEALSSGTFILEEDNSETRAFVAEGDGVVFFSSTEDLAAKIDYYLTHDAEREAIARRGHAWFHEHYSATRWAAGILTAVGLTSRE